jgi:hypothetical protein
MHGLRAVLSTQKVRTASKNMVEDTSLTGDFCDGFRFIMTNFIDHSIVDRERRRCFELMKLLSINEVYYGRVCLRRDEVAGNKNRSTSTCPKQVARSRTAPRPSRHLSLPSTLSRI